MWKNTKESWGLASQLMHWGMAIIVISLLIVGTLMSDMKDSPDKFILYYWHKSFGVLVLILTLARLWLRNSSPIPADSPAAPHWQNKLARWNVIALYALLFTFPITGLAMSLLGGHDVSFFSLFTLKALAVPMKPLATLAWEIHGFSFNVMLVLLSGHLLGGLYHHYIIKDNILRRMLPWTKA